MERQVPRPGGSSRLLRVITQLVDSIQVLDESVKASASLRESTGPAERNYHARRTAVVGLLNAGEPNRAREAIDALFDVQWRAPENAYLLGIVLLCQGQTDAARQVIDRALAVAPWLPEVPLTTADLDARLRSALREQRDWDWARYRLELDAVVTFGLTRTSAYSEALQGDDVFIVQVGAGDGQGDLSAWIEKFNWRGVLIEPIPELFEQLELKYREVDGIRLIKAALSDDRRRRTIYLDPSSPGRATFFPERTRLRLNTGLTELDVDTVTFSSVLDDAPPDRLGLLNIDVSGYDWSVLQAFDFDAWQPDVVVVGFDCLPIVERLSAMELLRRHGYAWRLDGRHLCCVRRDAYAPKFGLIESDGPGA